MRNIHRHLGKIGHDKKHLEGDAHRGIPGMISVCMPNYNKGAFIRQAIKSIYEQSLKTFELCIVDDCSTDGSKFEIHRALEEYPIRHKKLFLTKRMGTAWAQNISYYLAEGQYIANMDSDDLSATNRLLRQKQMLDSGEFDLVGTNFSVFRDSWESPDLRDGGVWLKYDPEEILDSYLIRGVHCLCFGTAMFTQKVLELTGGLDKTFIGTEDYGFIDKVASKGFKLGNTREILYYYRQNDTQRSKLFHSSSV